MAGRGPAVGSLLPTCLDSGRIRVSPARAGGRMTSILEVPDEKPATAVRGPNQALAMAGIGLGVVALGLATYLLVELRDARRQIAQLTEQTRSADKRAKEMDLALAAVRGQTVSVAQRAGFTATELEKTAEA